ncbi:hypothetical protein ACQ4LE_009065 [Meloidogyne hapla]
MLPLKNKKTNKRPKINKAFESSSSTIDSTQISQEQIISISKCVVELLKPTIEQIVRSIIQEIIPSFNNTTTSTSQPWGSHPFSSNISEPPLQHFINISNYNTSHQETIISKSKTAVVEKFPETDGDNELLREIVKDCGLGEELDEKEIHRHASKRETNSLKPKIYKIHFKSSQSRDKFLKTFRKIVKSNPQKYPQHTFCRRDMSPPELKLLYSLRKQAFELNKKFNLYKFIVIDLKIVELSTPKPLRTRQA